MLNSKQKGWGKAVFSVSNKQEFLFYLPPWFLNPLFLIQNCFLSSFSFSLYVCICISPSSLFSACVLYLYLSVCVSLSVCVYPYLYVYPPLFITFLRPSTACKTNQNSLPFPVVFPLNHLKIKPLPWDSPDNQTLFIIKVLYHFIKLKQTWAAGMYPDSTCCPICSNLIKKL